MPDWEAKIRERLRLQRIEPAKEAEIVEELTQHLEEHYESALREGATGEEAYQSTLVELGESTPHDLELRSHSNTGLSSAPRQRRTRAGQITADFWQDIRFTLRGLKKKRSFALLAILALSLGIGCATVGFGVVQNLLFDPYPYKGADWLVTFSVHDVKAERVARPIFTLQEFVDYQKNNHVFEDLVGTYNGGIVYTSQGGAESLLASYVTPNTFQFLDVPPLLGRWIMPEDGKPGAPPVFAMNYRLWKERFGGDPKILGTVFTLNDHPRTLIGIMPPRFQPFGGRVWLPITMNPSEGNSVVARPGAGLFLLGRLKRGTTLQSAGADLDVIARQLDKVYVGYYPPEFAIVLRPLNDAVMGNFKGMLYALMAAVLMLLLIACSNVANLLLARATTRDREIAIRTSIGASPVRLVRQLLAESFVLSAAGFAGGCILAYFGLQAVVATIPWGPLPDEAVIGLNPTVLFLSLSAALFTTFLCGLAPALHAVRGDLPARLASSGRGAVETLRHGKLRTVLVVSEVALSLLLLTGAGLMVRSFVALTRVDLGFNPSTIFFTEVNFAKTSYDKVEQQQRFFGQILERIQALPGVKAAATFSSIPALGGGGGSQLEVPGRTHSDVWAARMDFCSAGFFQTLGLQLRNGRLLTQSDIDSRRTVAVVNQALVRKFFGQDDPIGTKIKLKAFDNLPDAPGNGYFEIIGVVSDYKNQGARETPAAQVFLPATISTVGRRAILVSTALDTEALAPEVRRAIWAADRSVAMGANGSIESWLQQTAYKPPHFGSILLGTFAVIGLVLVGIGVFSTMAYTVSLQFHELGIRMALGAQRSDILRMVLYKGLRLIVLGMLAGLLASYGATRLMASQLWGVSVTDAWTFCAAALIIVAAGLAACFWPAEKATKVDPINAIRCE